MYCLLSRGLCPTWCLCAPLQLWRARLGPLWSRPYVKEQHEPDGTFPTVSFPNPEEPGAA